MKKAVSVFSFLLLSLITIAQEKGKPAKDINLPGIKGKAISLASLQGKVVLIDFWASWCIPCRKAVPHLKALYNKYKGKGFEIYGVSLDTDDGSWKNAVLEDKTSWLHVIDTSGVVAGDYNVNYIPNTYLLDKTGKVVAINPTKEELQKALQKLLP